MIGKIEVLRWRIHTSLFRTNGKAVFDYICRHQPLKTDHLKIVSIRITNYSKTILHYILIKDHTSLLSLSSRRNECLQIVHQQLKCRCSIYVVLCTLSICCAKNFDEMFTLFHSFRMFPGDWVLQCQEWVLNERFNADNVIFTYDKNHSLYDIVILRQKSQ